MEYCIEKFLSTTTPFLDGQRFDKFMEELRKISNYQEKLKKLIADNPEWIEAARETKNADGKPQICFFLDEKRLKKGEVPKENELMLRIFDMGTCPTIKVQTFVKA